MFEGSGLADENLYRSVPIHRGLASEENGVTSGSVDPRFSIVAFGKIARPTFVAVASHPVDLGFVTSRPDSSLGDQRAVFELDRVVGETMADDPT